MAYIRHIETLVPTLSYAQTEIQSLMSNWLSDETAKRYVETIYPSSGIEKRHSVVENLNLNSKDGFFKSASDGSFHAPSTRERNDLYSTACSNMVVELASSAISKCDGINRGDITHVITVSCTGFYSPGPDYVIIKQLGLAPTVQRYHLGFMGCYAAVPALRMAQQFCQANQEAVVLVVCIELCTLHLKLSNDLDSIISNSLFADGSSAAIVTATLPTTKKPFFEMETFSSAVLAEGEDDMAWRIGDSGFDMILTRYVPKIIGANIPELVSSILQKHGLTISDIGVWAIHPGGKSILDSIHRKLSLHPDQLKYSRDILRQYGNMSSATILFVLKAIMEQSRFSAKENIFAIAFGPGLTVESSMLSLHQSASKFLSDSEEIFSENQNNQMITI